LGRAIGRVMCLSDVFLPNTQEKTFISFLFSKTTQKHAHKIKLAR